MYKNLAFINGILLAVMIFFNGMLSRITGPYLSTLIFHLLGFFVILAISAVMKNRLPNITKVPPFLILPGILGVITIFLNNICIPQIGISLTAGLSLYGQLLISGVVDHFGLFGMPVNRFSKRKIPGFLCISLGVVLMIFL